MKRIYRVYKKTVSIVNETATGMYRNLVAKKKGDVYKRQIISCLEMEISVKNKIFHTQDLCLGTNLRLSLIHI